jgi:hypothetical protein
MNKENKLKLKKKKQWTRIGDSKTSPHSDSHLTFYKRITNVFEKTQSLQQMVLGKLDIRLKISYCLLSCRKVNSKWIKELSVRPKNLKLL